MTIKSFLPVALTAVALGACSGNLVRLQSEVAPSTYKYSNFTLYHAGRDTKVEIHGNPFHMDAAAFARAVTDHMQGANVGRPTHFTTTPGPSAERNMRVVMAFNSESDGYDLCTGHRFRAEKPGDVLSLKAAWCFGDREDSSVEAVVGTAKSVNDPRFHELVGQTVMNLFPTNMDYELLWDHGDDHRRD